MPQVVRPNAVIDPRAMATENQSHASGLRLGNGFSLIMFCNAAPTTLTMLASDRLPDHASHTKVLFVEFPLLKKSADDCSLLIPTPKFRNKARIFDHGVNVEVGRQTIEYDKKDVQKRSGGVCCYKAGRSASATLTMALSWVKLTYLAAHRERI